MWEVGGWEETKWVDNKFVQGSNFRNWKHSKLLDDVNSDCLQQARLWGSGWLQAESFLPPN